MGIITAPLVSKNPQRNTNQEKLLPINTFFFCPGKDYYQLSEASLCDPMLLAGYPGRVSWTALSYYYLKNSFGNIYLTAKVPEEGIVFYHPNDKRRLFAKLKPSRHLYIVSITADAYRQYYADCNLFQNLTQPLLPSDKHCHFWPMPGIVQRNPERGSQITNVSYKGHQSYLRPDFKENWVSALNKMKLVWRTELNPLSENPEHILSASKGWGDFSDVDINIAIRPKSKDLWPRKPASKLINAWIAGVPSLVTPELAYRSLKRNELDYIEIQSVLDALAALKRLIENPSLYTDMIANAKERALEFSHDKMVGKWHENINWIQQSADKKRRSVGLKYVLKSKSLMSILGRIEALMVLLGGCDLKD